MKKRIMSVVGTRPEAIKMAPIILALRQQDWVDQSVISSGQHAQLLAPILDFFGFGLDADLGISGGDLSLGAHAARLLEAMDGAIQRFRPDCILVQGDTSTTAMAALAGFYRRVPVAHVEAGLRTYDHYNPFPEELNRVMAGRIAELHFAPTEAAADALRAEGVADSQVMVTGNSGIDAMQLALARRPALPFDLPPDHRIVLVTVHRRENWGGGMARVCGAVLDLLAAVPDAYIVWPVHPNPQVKQLVMARLDGQVRVRLCPPLDYPAFVALMARAYLILTDSGGVQEEGPALAKPVLVLRETTERPEAVLSGVVELVGTQRAHIVARAIRLLRDEPSYRAMARGTSPYGDGQATGRIIARLKTHLQATQPASGQRKRPG